ncbi:hypothetical protein CVV38_04095 [Candidatus Peregrinibacteria bacterium HGW-Peregrinibacteria-1]|jgi:hypothetical protein|nr:MAG: hypothetical protein CVV38_04095 [Candidatus Peregrinibacteria bacterium HGW-Peregrinibacteria-1]
MCFSATASFVASGVLAATGVVALSQVRKKRDLMLALIPLIFALQQLIEGVLWMNVGTGNLWEAFSKQGFLFFALFWWPAFVPWVCFAIEREKFRRKIMVWLFVIGVIIGTFLYVRALTLPANVEILNACLNYKLELFWPYVFSGGYLLVVFASFIASSEKLLRVFGVTLMISAVLAWGVFRSVFISVWCFFSAVLSVIICVYLIKKKKKYGFIKTKV